MPKVSRYTDEEVTNAVKQGGDFGAAAKILTKLDRGTMTRQGVRYLYERITKKSGATSALPPPTKEEKEAVQKIHRPVKQTASGVTLDMVEDWLAEKLKEAGEARKLRNQVALLTEQMKEKNMTIERLQRELAAEKDQRRKREAVAVLVAQGDLPGPTH